VPEQSGGQAARRSYRWCRPPTWGSSTISPMVGGCPRRSPDTSRDQLVGSAWFTFSTVICPVSVNEPVASFPDPPVVG
jgi:hypothetical protein